jgi:Na+/H+ antiporter NhaD/arsenite permease-like protein
MLEAALPTTLGLLATWAVIARQYRGRWSSEGAPPDADSRAGVAKADPRAGAPHADPRDGVARADPRDGAAPLPTAALDRWQTAKGLAVAIVLMGAFLLAPWPRELVALAGAGLLLTSRKLHSRDMLGLVDWQLLVLFVGLFVVNDAMARTGLPATAVAWLQAQGADLTLPGPLFVATVLLSNAVSNVPAVMLLLPLATHEVAGPLLALVSTLSGNLLIVGSIANIIVVDAAARHGIEIDWRRHARTGVPVTLATLALAAAYLALRSMA